MGGIGRWGKEWEKETVFKAVGYSLTAELILISSEVYM